eukprot:scaffold22630_cov57-Phaeocystis_antarctica.AAC.1
MSARAPASSLQGPMDVQRLGGDVVGALASRINTPSLAPLDWRGKDAPVRVAWASVAEVDRAL